MQLLLAALVLSATIYSAHDVDTQQLFPYAAKIEWRFEDGDSEIVGTCTGSLCVVDEGSQRHAQPSKVRVFVGGAWHDAEALMVHEGYENLENDMRERSNDVAMVELAQPSSVRPIALPAARQPDADTAVWTAGYGIYDTQVAEVSDVLWYTRLDVYADGECPPGYAGPCPAGFADDLVAGGFAGYTCGGNSASCKRPHCASH
ncbi:hypothetical protein ABPG75_001635 [Micractinium tetrahymenae]